MAGIIPIPTTRVGDLFVRQRLTRQVQLDQLALFRLQNQISTGRRIQLPSEDAPAALRAINVQRLLDRKGQIKTNLQSSSQYLNGAWDRIGWVSDRLVELRGTVVGVIGNVGNESNRQAAVQDVNALLQELVNSGNAKIGGRYLFAGSRSQSQPYDFNGNFVEYSGNEGLLRSYVDLERLFDTNVSGTDVFGGISAAVEGRVDLNPQVMADTLVNTLNGGAGIGGSPAITLAINDGLTTTSSVVDLGGAVTVGDLARLIEAGAPAGADVSVEVTGTGLVIRAAGGDTIRVLEVAEGHTARMLGVLSDHDIPATGTITGLDLDPALLKTTRLSDLLGKKATGQIQFSGSNNDIQLTANVNGVAFNDVDVVFVDGVVAGSESAVYDSGTRTLTVTVDDGNSTAEQVATAITAEGTFTATLDYRDAESSLQVGTGEIGLGGSSLTFVDVTSGGGGEPLDTASGLHLTNGGESVTLDVSGATTVEDLLNLINGAGLSLLAEVNTDGNGINVRSRLNGADFMIGENGGTTATQLGLRTYTGDTELASLNRGVGVPTTSTLEALDTAQLDQLRIVARDGATIDVDFTGATTLQDVVSIINNDTENNVGTTSVLARSTGDSNGIELVDSSTAATGQLRVEVLPGTTAAEYLGFVPAGATQQSSTEADSSGNDLLRGRKLLGNDLLIVARSGVQLSIDLAGATTVQEVIDRINNNADNAPPVITAQLARVGNGIEIIDSSGGAGTLTIRSVEGSLAAEYLGFVAAGETQSDPSDVTVEGANHVLQSEDRNTFEADSVFNTLLRLRNALQENDDIEIGRLLDRLDVDTSRLNFSRGEIGGRLQSLDAIGIRLEDEDVQLRAALSLDIDIDLVAAISELTARQYAFEASLRTTASLVQMTLLNFL
jgi:flagellin-like hook-associated protein FlgL